MLGNGIRDTASRVWHPFWSRKDEVHWIIFIVGITAFDFLSVLCQLFRWWERHSSSKNLCLLSTKVLFWNRWREKTEKEPINPGSPEKQPLKCSDDGEVFYWYILKSWLDVSKNKRNIHHTYIRLTALCPGLPRWVGTGKVKPIWILLEQETVSGSGISCAICKSAPRSRPITTPAPHHSVFAGRMPFLLPNQQHQSTEGNIRKEIYCVK